MGNIPRSIQREDLEESFRDHHKFKMSVDRVDMKGSYAFVHLRGRQLDRCIRKINPMYWNGQRLTVEFAKSNEIQKWDERKYYRTNRTLFVVNFDEEKVRQADIEELFGKYGNLRRVSVRRNFAFVEFEELSDATEAKSKLNGYTFRGKDIIVRYAASPDDKLREDELNERQNRRRQEIAARNARGRMGMNGMGRGDMGNGMRHDGPGVPMGMGRGTGDFGRGRGRGRKDLVGGRRRIPSPFYQTKRTPSRSRSRERR